MRPKSIPNIRPHRGLGDSASDAVDDGSIKAVALAFAGQLANHARAALPRLGRALLLLYVGGTELPNLSGDRANPVRFGGDGLGGYHSELISTLGGFRHRLRLYRSIILVARTGLLVVAAALLFRFLDLVSVLAEPTWLPYLLGLIALGGIGLISSQSISYLEVARVVDRQLGLKAQLGTAVELTLEGEPTRLARSQVRQATTIARRLKVRQAVSARAPWRDLRLGSFALAGLLVVSLLLSAGFRAPTPEQLTQAGLEALDPALNSWYELDPASAAELSQGERGTSGLQAVVDKLRGQLDRNEISPIEYESQVAAVEDQIRQQAADSSRQQVALSDLARSLSETSSTRGVAESLNRGDYSNAVQELSDLALQTDRMSEQARQDLAQRLSEAARSMAGSNEALSRAADRASEALRSGDKEAAEAALKELASAVAGASEQVSPQSELGEALRGAQEAQGETGQSANGTVDSADGAASDGGDGTDSSGAGQGQRPPDGSTSANAASGSGAGSAPGEKITAADSPNQALKPDAGVTLLKIVGRASGSGANIRSDAPTNAPASAASTGAATIQSTSARSSEQVNAIGEVNDVPLDLRSVVKDYFSGNGQP